MGRPQKSSPGPKQPKSKIKCSPNVTKERVKKDPITFFEGYKQEKSAHYT